MVNRSDILWDSKEAAIVTGGINTKEWMATGVCVRAEDICKGDLFIASEGEDLKKVMRKGAVAAVVSHVPDDLKCEMPLLKVASPYDALRDIARAARFRSHSTVLAVQGLEMRQMVNQAFGVLGPSYDGGRILSVGMANMPEDYDFGIFSLAPAVRPDIAIITDSKGGISDRLFENMPKTGAVILNRDCSDFYNVMARAKAAGIESIYSFGIHTGADARVMEHLSAANGTRLYLDILGDKISMVMDGDVHKAMAAAGVLLAAKICGRNIRQAARVWQVGEILKPGGPDQKSLDQSLSLFESQAASSEQAVFRIQNLIDLGYGRQTAVLDNLAFPDQPGVKVQKNDLAIPRRIANLDFVYACKGVSTVANAQTAIRTMHAKAKLETIVTDVLAPGDFVVFEQPMKKQKATLAEALRLKLRRKQGRQVTGNAL
ncbi:MAG: UDP-N-acetylmuramoyl-tripeptide--D-alanyl-D-alanine ligase [Micavibrio sp.]|nr:MAG: UDP-N-acetylmuramoyl-tripeptide--D-alanyl-D-alanine ligase [Micavibrio sp.]